MSTTDDVFSPIGSEYDNDPILSNGDSYDALGEQPKKKRKFPLDKDGYPTGPNVIKFPEPMRLAEHFLRAEATDARGRILLRRFRKEWWQFVRGVGGYRQLTDEDANCQLYQHLDKLYVPEIDKKSKQPTGEVQRLVAKIYLVNEVSKALTACNTMVSGEMPQWLDGRAGPSPRDVVAFQNGVLDTVACCGGLNGLMLPDPNWFSGVACPYDFAPDATCLVWLKTIADIFNGDAESIAPLQEWFGLMLVPDNRYEKIMLFVGRPRSGKGTVISMLTAMLGGDQIASTSFAKLAGRFGLHPLIGRLAAVLPDAHISKSTDDKAALEALKSISGGDDQSIDRKGITELPRVPLPIRFTIAVNELPRLPDEAGALKPRLLLLNFPNTYAGREDTSLKQILPSEAPGVAVWALQGLARLRSAGVFTVPQKSIEIVSEFERAVSPIKSFIFDRCELQADTWISKDELFAAWSAWCKDRGTEHGNASKFGEHLINAEPGRIKAGRHGPRGSQFTTYDGVKLCD